MRPVGVTIIAVLTWIRGSMYALTGLFLLVVGHVSARLVSTMASDPFFETLFSRVGKALGFGALVIAAAYIVVGLGLWQLKNWARAVTVILVGIWLLFWSDRIIAISHALACRAYLDRWRDCGVPHASRGEKTLCRCLGLAYSVPTSAE
jgi:hypothetical protein